MHLGHVHTMKIIVLLSLCIQPLQTHSILNNHGNRVHPSRPKTEREHERPNHRSHVLYSLFSARDKVSDFRCDVKLNNL